MDMRLTLALFLWLAGLATGASAQTDPAEGIVSVTNLGGSREVRRINFNYTSVDSDNETPLLLSGAVYISGELYDRRKNATGWLMLNHFTITDNAACPTENTSLLTLEGQLAQQTDFIVVAPDNLGFGLTRSRPQAYLNGEVTAKQSIDALLTARRLLEEEGYDAGDRVVNMGYSQGGHSAMWVSRLVEEGYRGEELSHIDYAIVGGGPYDITGIYRRLIEENHTQYPVALPLILYGCLDREETNFGVEDVFAPELVGKLPLWFDSKELTTTEINDSIYQALGSDGRVGIETSRIVTVDVMTPESELMKRLIPYFDRNSLVYDSWTPTKTDSIFFVHSRADEVVPFLCMENMGDFLTRQGYEDFSVDDSSPLGHTSTGTLFLLRAVARLQTFEKTVTGIRNAEMADGTAGAVSAGVDVYSVSGSLVRRNVERNRALDGLSPGIYVVGGVKRVVPSP